MKLKPSTLYQERWFVRGEERGLAGSDKDYLTVSGGRERRKPLPEEIRRRLATTRDLLEARQHYSTAFRGGDEVLLDDFKQRDHGKRVILKTVRYRDLDLADRRAVEARRRAFLQEIEVLAQGYYFLPEPVDRFTLPNTQDLFPADAEDLRASEPVLVYAYKYDTHLYFLMARYGRDSFGFARVRRILEQLITFAAKLHRDGWLLQNLTPEHVMLGADDVVRLTGVGGVCRLAGGKVDPAAPNLGRITRGYSDPVLARTQDLQRMDWRHDLYGVAAVGYYLLTGMDPAGSADGLPDLGRLWGPGRVLARALDPDPERRFDSWDAFRQALEVGRPPQTAVFVDVANATRGHQVAYKKDLDFIKLKRQLSARYPEEELHFILVVADYGRGNQEGFFRVLERVGRLVRVPAPPGQRGMRQLDDVHLVQALRKQVDQVQNVIIVSADADFLAALETARERGCRVRQLGFGSPARAVQDAGWIHERIDPAALGDLSLERR